MIEVTVLFLDQTFSSTAVGPMEVFRHAGTLWNLLTGKAQSPRFHVTTASADGRAVLCDGPIRIKPMAAIQNIRKTDLIFIPTTGLGLDDVVERNAPVVPWLKRWHKRGAAIASVCSGVGLVAATGMLDGKRATTNKMWFNTLVQYGPNVDWVKEARWVEDGKFVTSSGVSAGIDMALAVIARMQGEEISKNLAVVTEYEWHRDAHWDPFAKVHGLVWPREMPNPRSAIARRPKRAVRP